ncbi:MAG: T9SS type A sorting domain-containing protein, partial [Saprospiraceae bacterium]
LIMKKIYTSVHSRQFVAISALCIFATMLAAQPAIQWQKTFGGSNYDEAHAIRQTSDGGYIVSGRTDSNDGDVGSGNHGSADGWILKLTAQGDIEWKKILGGTKGDSFGDIQQTPDGGYIVGGATTSDDGDISGLIGVQDIWILKLNGTGDIQWNTLLGGSGVDFGSSIAQADDGGFVVLGLSHSPEIANPLNNGTSSDIYVVKLSATGAIQWQKALGGSGQDQGFEIQKVAEGGYVILGRTTSNDGDVSGFLGGLWDSWLVKINDLGEIEWQRTLGGSGSDRASGVLPTNDGGYLVTGSTESQDGDLAGNHGFQDCWVIKLNSTGDIQWQKTLGGSAIDNGSGAVETSDGGYMVCASTASNDEDVETIHGEFDAWLLKLNENGQLQWQKPLGGSRSDYANTIQRTNDNGHVLAGNTRSDDGDVTINQGQSDFWIIKMGAESVGLEEILPSTSDARLGIFPNPANQTISLSIPEQMPAMTARVFDFLGRQISQQILPNGSSLDISLLPNGLYSIVATTPSGNVFSNKFRKQD